MPVGEFKHCFIYLFSGTFFFFIIVGETSTSYKTKIVYISWLC